MRVLRILPKIVLMTLPPLTTLAAGCGRIGGPSELTRSKAANLIQQALNNRVQRGRFFTRPNLQGPGWEDPPGLRNALVKAGYLTTTDAKSIYGKDTLFTTGYVLTNKGKSAANDWEQFPYTIVGEVLDWAYSPPLAAGALVEITGIAEAANSADVDFTWRWSPVALANELVRADPNFRMWGSAPERETLPFRKYDDGWRLQQ